MTPTPGQVCYEGYCGGNERMMAWESLPASDRERWENTAAHLFHAMVGRAMISGSSNGEKFIGRVQSVLPQLWQLEVGLSRSS